jgi:hypothetical protein
MVLRSLFVSLSLSDTKWFLHLIVRVVHANPDRVRKDLEDLRTVHKVVGPHRPVRQGSVVRRDHESRLGHGSRKLEVLLRL